MIGQSDFDSGAMQIELVGLVASEHSSVPGGHFSEKLSTRFVSVNVGPPRLPQIMAPPMVVIYIASIPGCCSPVQLLNLSRISVVFYDRQTS